LDLAVIFLKIGFVLRKDLTEIANLGLFERDITFENVDLIVAEVALVGIAEIDSTCGFNESICCSS